MRVNLLAFIVPQSTWSGGVRLCLCDPLIARKVRNALARWRPLLREGRAFILTRILLTPAKTIRLPAQQIAFDVFFKSNLLHQEHDLGAMVHAVGDEVANCAAEGF